MLAIYLGRKSKIEVHYKCDKLKYRSYTTRAAIDSINKNNLNLRVTWKLSEKQNLK